MDEDPFDSGLVAHVVVRRRSAVQLVMNLNPRMSS